MIWHRVLDASELPEATLRQVQLEGRDVCVVRYEGDVHAFDDACPHRQWPLHVGHLDRGVLRCRAHTWEWDVRTGELQRMRAPECLTMHSARERDGSIEIGVAPDAPAPRAISPLWRHSQQPLQSSTR